MFQPFPDRYSEEHATDDAIFVKETPDVTVGAVVVVIAHHE
jgi:hypothetical protein